MLPGKMQPPSQLRMLGISVINDDHLLVSDARLLGLGHARAGVNIVVIYCEIVGCAPHGGQEESKGLWTLWIRDICKAKASPGIFSSPGGLYRVGINRIGHAGRCPGHQDLPIGVDPLISAA